MSWLFATVAIVHVFFYTGADFAPKPVAKLDCDIPGNDSVLISIKGKLFTCQSEVNKTYYFSVCGVSHPSFLLSGPLVLFDSFGPHSLTVSENAEVKIPPLSEGMSQASKRILILRGSEYSITQTTYIYFHCGHIETLSLLSVNREHDPSITIFEVTVPNLCGPDRFPGIWTTNIVCIVLLVLVFLGVLFNLVVNKAVRRLSWTESIPLVSACCQVRTKFRSRLLLRRARLAEPRYIRVPMDSPKTTTGAAGTPSVPRYVASNTKPLIVRNQDSQDECLLSL